MGNSDNVVDGGLTSETKDSEILVNMLKYEFKDVIPSFGNKIVDTTNTKVTEYRTGSHECMLTHVEMGKQTTMALSCEFSSMAIACVIKGNAFINIDGFGNTVLEENTSYYILPKNKFTLQKNDNKDDKEVSIFFASCDI